MLSRLTKLSTAMPVNRRYPETISRSGARRVTKRKNERISAVTLTASALPVQAVRSRPARRWGAAIAARQGWPPTGQGARRKRLLDFLYVHFVYNQDTGNDFRPVYAGSHTPLLVNGYRVGVEAAEQRT